MKKLIKLSATLLLSLGLFACGANTDNTNTENTSQAVEQSTQETITISHSMGETTVKLNPQKVVIFDMGILDTINSLGIDAEFALPVSSVPTYIEGYEDALNVGTLKEPNLEEIYNFKPDVIFISGRQVDFYEELNKIAPTIYVDLDYTKYMEDLKTNILNVGTIFNKQDLAMEKYNQLVAKIETAKEKVAKTDEKALVILTNGGKISVFGPGSRFGIIYDVLGYKEADENIYKEGEEISTHGKEISYEYISQINPDILFVVDRDSVVGGEGDATVALNNDLIKNTNAYKNNKIIMLNPEYWYIAGGGLTSVENMVDEATNFLN